MISSHDDGADPSHRLTYPGSVAAQLAEAREAEMDEASPPYTGMTAKQGD